MNGEDKEHTKIFVGKPESILGLDGELILK
jgi:hypothetical protein